jgi:hypothetical protein
MKQNPCFVKHDYGYIIRFVRQSWKVLTWVQDLTGRKMKDAVMVSCPVVVFDTKSEVEEELRNIVIPYLLKEKGIEQKEIIGW